MKPRAQNSVMSSTAPGVSSEILDALRARRRSDEQTYLIFSWLTSVYAEESLLSRLSHDTLWLLARESLELATVPPYGVGMHATN